MGFEKYLADDCMWKRKIEKGNIVVCVYIDDTLCMGNEETIDDFKQEISIHFPIKEEEEMKG